MKLSFCVRILVLGFLLDVYVSLLGSGSRLMAWITGDLISGTSTITSVLPSRLYLAGGYFDVIDNSFIDFTSIL